MLRVCLLAARASSDMLAYTHCLSPGRSGNWYQTLALTLGSMIAWEHFIYHCLLCLDFQIPVSSLEDMLLQRFSKFPYCLHKMSQCQQSAD